MKQLQMLNLTKMEQKNSSESELHRLLSSNCPNSRVFNLTMKLNEMPHVNEAK